jgi:hypothetical protein
MEITFHFLIRKGSFAGTKFKDLRYVYGTFLIVICSLPLYLSVRA